MELVVAGRSALCRAAVLLALLAGLFAMHIMAGGLHSAHASAAPVSSNGVPSHDAAGAPMMDGGPAGSAQRPSATFSPEPLDWV